MQQASHPLVEWIDARMTRAEFARQVGTSEGHLSLVLQRKRGLSLDLAVRIEDATGGEFTATRLQREQQQAEAAE